MEYTALLAEIFRHGTLTVSKDKTTRELMYQDLEVSEDCIYTYAHARELHLITKYLYAELAWYMSGDFRNSSWIAKHAKLWDAIKNVDGSLNSNYGFLVFYNKQRHPALYAQEILPPFEWAARCLEKEPTTRQGVVTYNTGAYNYENNRDYICSQHQAFYIRDGKLLCYVALRSSDAIYGLAYNMPWWQLVYQQMYLRLIQTYPNLQKEPIKVKIYSAHLYEAHFKLVQNMLLAKKKVYRFELIKTIPLYKSLDWYDQNIKDYVKIY